MLRPKDMSPLMMPPSGEKERRRKMRANPVIVPRDRNLLAVASGRKIEKILEPSIGGMGRRLIIPSTRF